MFSMLEFLSNTNIGTTNLFGWHRKYNFISSFLCSQGISYECLYTTYTWVLYFKTVIVSFISWIIVKSRSGIFNLHAFFFLLVHVALCLFLPDVLNCAFNLYLQTVGKITSMSLYYLSLERVYLFYISILRGVDTI